MDSSSSAPQPSWYSVPLDEIEWNFACRVLNSVQLHGREFIRIKGGYASNNHLTNQPFQLWSRAMHGEPFFAALPAAVSRLLREYFDHKTN
jgi:hypothetical protein